MITTRYYLRFTVLDRLKVLAPIASILGEHSISIASVMQQEGHRDDRVPVIILTHPAREADLQNAVAEIQKMEFVKAQTRIIRIEE